MSERAEREAPSPGLRATAGSAWAIVGPHVGGWALVSSSLRAAERVLFVLSALELAKNEFLSSVAVAGSVGVLAVARSVVRGIMAKAARTKLHLAAVDALLEGDVLAASALPDEDAQNALLEGVDAGERIATVHLPDVVGDALGAMAVAAILWLRADARVLVLGAIAMGLGIVTVAVARRFTQREIERSWHAYVPVMDHFIALFRGRLEIVAHGLDRRFRGDVGRALEAHARTAARSERLVALAGRAPLVGAMVAVVLAIGLDASLRGTSGLAAVGQAAVLASALPTFAGLAGALQEIVRASARFEPLAALLDAPRRSDEGSAAAPELPARIELDDVSFAYPGAERDALSAVSIAWEPGRVLALTGPNGSGKSTCLRLLLGVASPRTGTIRVGGVDLKTLDARALRARVAYLPQAPCIPERSTVREAMHLVAPDASDDALRSALDKVGVWSVLAARSADAPLEVRAATLSSGQRQRVALARVLAREADIVLLDEPDANLDADGVALVGRIVKELAQTRMVAVVAHTPELAAVGDVKVPFARAA